MWTPAALAMIQPAPWEMCSGSCSTVPTFTLTIDRQWKLAQTEMSVPPEENKYQTETEVPDVRYPQHAHQPKPARLPASGRMRRRRAFPLGLVRLPGGLCRNPSG